MSPPLGNGRTTVLIVILKLSRGFGRMLQVSMEDYTRKWRQQKGWRYGVAKSSRSGSFRPLETLVAHEVPEPAHFV